MTTFPESYFFFLSLFSFFLFSLFLLSILIHASPPPTVAHVATATTKSIPFPNKGHARADMMQLSPNRRQLLRLLCGITIQTVYGDYEDYKSNVKCMGTSAGDCNLVGMSGNKCYVCDPAGRNHNLPAGYPRDYNGEVSPSCNSRGRNHYCAKRPDRFRKSPP